jgi:hypothetical protein
MEIVYKTRQLYPDEQRILKTLKTKKEKKGGSKIKFYHYLIAAVVGAGCTWVAALNEHNFWILPFGTLAVLSFGFIVFMPYEVYKQQKVYKNFLKQLTTAMEKGTVDTCVIHAKRIAFAEEYEDEGDLYIIECDTDTVLYMWDNEYNMQKKFPCLDFEIYEEGFSMLTGRLIYPSSGRIQPIIIDKKAKWNYMGKIGSPGHLQIDNVNFYKLIEEYNSCA